MLIKSCRHVYYARHDENQHGHRGGCCHNEDRHSHGHDEHCHGEGRHGHGYGERCHGEGRHGHGHGERCHGEGRHGHGHGERCHGEGRHGHGHGERCHGEGRHGRGHGDDSQRGRGRGKGLRRLFDHGDLHIMVLSLVAKKPSYGYEIIKDIQEASNGLYVPSPGVIYPTLTLLEEQGFLESQIVERNRKSFTITPEGSAHLAQNKEIEAVIARKLAKARDMQQGSNLAEDIEVAVSRFKALLRHKMVLKQLNEEQTRQIASIINDAVKQIEEVNTLLTNSDED
ncbi:PadR family transcriptional regulator [Providencia hangzhouensis]|uniref:PadR family transcriptional regulator n=1 Tax=Providencia rettgeri TaxID=587 RepID=A0AAW6UAJ2_PRORE|nr:MULTISPECIES: PadR family transcriptional regulator [Providencia]MDI9092154.1 PadR family transcriptional regulator [Providencia rettgeri]WOB86558.1 PadR family transcriptional regulator [Providencia sp. PROV040]